MLKGPGLLLGRELINLRCPGDRLDHRSILRVNRAPIAAADEAYDANESVRHFARTALSAILHTRRTADPDLTSAHRATVRRI